MKSGIWRLASCSLLSLAIAGQALAEGQGGRTEQNSGQWQGHANQGGQGHQQQGNGGGQPQGHQPQPGNGGGQWQGHQPPPGNAGGQWQGHQPQPGNGGGQWQGHQPQPGNAGGQWQGHQPQPGNAGGQWQGHQPQPGNGGGQWQGHQPQPGYGGGQWQGHQQPSNNDGGQWPGRQQAEGNAAPQRQPVGTSTAQWQGHAQQSGPSTQWQARPSSERDERGQSGWGDQQRGEHDPQWRGRPSGHDDWHGHSGGNWGPHPDYWRPGYVVDRVPPGHYRVPWRGSDYFFSDGYWYRPYGSRFVMVTPPYGMRVNYLPSYAEQIWIGSMLYFVAAGTYYLFESASQTYEVVAPPAQVAQQPALATNPYEVIAYPMYNQSPQQQAQDRYECHTWAVGQSGFDPAMAPYAPPQQAVDAYRGAMAACLNGRGYSVN